jgi:uncharacterized protein (DUF305 family)
MTRPFALVLTATWAVAANGCGGTRVGSPPPPATPPATTSISTPHTAADVAFMVGMIAHHAQAVEIAGWAPSHGASDALRILAERIVVAQQDEIAYAQNWLRQRGEAVPTAGSHHHELMPGMLTPEQLAQLDRARGRDFDRLFLQLMIQHHRGALVMVDRLLASPGAAQDGPVFRFAADVHADQTTEINRMQLMLDALDRSPE